MKTLIVTLNYKQPDMIFNLGKSLMTHLKKDQFHWLIRDNTPDESVKERMVDFLDNPNVTFLRKENTGTFASQHNELMNEGHFNHYENLLMLNNDTLAVSDFLTPMVQNLRDASIGAVGANLYYQDKSLQHCGVAISERGDPFNINNNTAKALGLWPHINKVRRRFVAVTGACYLVRMEDYRKIGGMVDEYPWCFDDVELSFRIIKELGKVCVVEPEAQLYHFENVTTLKNPSNLKPSYHQAKKILQKAHPEMLEPNWELYKMDCNRHE